MQVKDLMTSEPARCRPDTTLREAARMMSDRDCGLLPVTAGDLVVGVVTDRDLACRGFARALNPLDVPVKQVMTTCPVTVDEQSTIERAVQLMERERVRRLPVVREGKLVGVISESEVVNVLPDSAVAELARRVSHSHRVLH